MQKINQVLQQEQIMYKRVYKNKVIIWRSQLAIDVQRAFDTYQKQMKINFENLKRRLYHHLQQDKQIRTRPQSTKKINNIQRIQIRHEEEANNSSKKCVMVHKERNLGDQRSKSVYLQKNSSGMTNKQGTQRQLSVKKLNKQGQALSQQKRRNPQGKKQFDLLMKKAQEDLKQFNLKVDQKYIQPNKQLQSHVSNKGKHSSRQSLESQKVFQGLKGIIKIAVEKQNFIRLLYNVENKGKCQNEHFFDMCKDQLLRSQYLVRQIDRISQHFGEQQWQQCKIFLNSLTNFMMMLNDYVNG